MQHRDEVDGRPRRLPGLKGRGYPLLNTLNRIDDLGALFVGQHENTLGYVAVWRV